MDGENENRVALEFVTKMFEDEDFAKMVFIKIWFLKKEIPGSGKEVDTQRMVEAGKQMEYEFTAEEYIKANETYLDSIGGFNTLKALYRLFMLQNKIENNIENNE